MRTHSTTWKTLIETPAPAVKAVKVSKESTKQANEKAWKALDQSDIDMLQEALAAGASQTTRRDGAPLIWEAVKRGHWEFAETLRANGFPVDVSTNSRQTMFDALAHRDFPEEAERLVSWGCDPQNIDDSWLVRKGRAPRLVEWWLDQVGHHKVPALNERGGEDEVEAWLLLAASGSPRLRELCNKRWGVDTQKTDGLARLVHNVMAIDRLWAHVLQKDNVEMMRECLKSGWAPKEINAVGIPFSWSAARARAWKVLDWMMQVPQAKEDFLEFGRSKPELSWWVVSSGSLPALENMLGYGIDLKQVNSSGDCFVHKALLESKVSRSMLDYLVKHFPEGFALENDKGKTPLQGMYSDSQRTSIESYLMSKMSVQAPKKSSPSRRL